MHRLLTERERHKLSSFVLIVGVAVLPMSLSLIAVTIYIRFVVDEELDLVQGMNTAVLPYFLAITGTINIVASLLLLSSMVGVHQPSSRFGSIRMLFISIICSLVATVLVFSACLFCFIQMALLPGEFQDGLSTAMKQYGRVPSVKTPMDLLQMEYECCGDQGYADWFTVPWISQELLMAGHKEVQLHAQPGTAYINDDVPFSCCDSGSPRPCIHHHVTMDRMHYKYENRVNTTLLTKGCRQVLMDFFGHTVLRSTGLALLFMFLAQAVILIVSRLLQTSMMGALEMGDLSATAEGYIFKPPQDTEADAERQKLLSGGGSEGTWPAGSETETGSEDGASSEDEAAAGIIQASSQNQRPATPPAEGEPLYENVIPEENIYDNPIETWESEEEVGQPLFPSEMADRAQHNSGHTWNNSAFTAPVPMRSARRPLLHRLGYGGGRSVTSRSISSSSSSSKAFNSLGIPLPRPSRQQQQQQHRSAGGAYRGILPIHRRPRVVPPPPPPSPPPPPPPPAPQRPVLHPPPPLLRRPEPLRPQYSSYRGLPCNQHS